MTIVMSLVSPIDVENELVYSISMVLRTQGRRKGASVTVRYSVTACRGAAAHLVTLQAGFMHVSML